MKPQDQGEREGGDDDGQSLNTAHKAVLDRSCRGARTRNPEPAGELGRGDGSRHLEQGQGNAPRLSHASVAHPRIQSAINTDPNNSRASAFVCLHWSPYSFSARRRARPDLDRAAASRG